MIYIYSLSDPFTGAIRYVGKSIRPKERLQNHCNDHSQTWRTHWIQEVLAKGGKPEIAILEELADDADWQAAERKWIAYGKNAGWSLTNCTSGGDGVPNLPPEVRARISRTWIGRKHKPESLVKIGESSKKRRWTDERRAMMSAKFKNRQFTPEWIDKIRKSNSKLTDDQVREIRQLIAQGVTHRTIGAKFNVDGGTISNIRRGLCYKNVA